MTSKACASETRGTIGPREKGAEQQLDLMMNRFGRNENEKSKLRAEFSFYATPRRDHWDGLVGLLGRERDVKSINETEALDETKSKVS